MSEYDYCICGHPLTPEHECPTDEDTEREQASAAKNHYLVIHETGIDYSIQHPDDCPTSEWPDGLPCNGPMIAYECPIGVTVGDVGLLDLDWEELAPGRYPIEFWSERHPAIPGFTVEEWSAGIRFTEATA